MSQWKEVKLGNIASVQTGPFGSQLHNEDYKESGTPIVTVEHLGNKKFTRQNLPRVSQEDCVRLAKYSMKTGDIIFSRVGAVDRCSLVSQEESGWLFSSRCLCVRANDEIDSEWLYYYFCLDTTKLNVRSIAVGATMPSINTKILSNDVFVKYPTSIESQRRIASILSSLDAKIENNNKINAKLEEIAQNLFKEWFVDFGPFKDGKFVESELGLIPEGWRVGTLGEILDIKYGKDHKKLGNGQIPVYGSGGLMRYANKYLYDQESVLIPRKGTLNNIMYVTEPFWTVDTMFYSEVKIPNSAIFAYQFLSQKDMNQLNSGTSIPSMTTEILNKQKLSISSEKVMQEYNNIVKSLYDQIKHNKLEASKLSTLRDTLLPKLMSGEIEV